MDFGRLKQVFKFGWLDSGSICKEKKWGASRRITAYLDILRCFFAYRMKSIQYKSEHFYDLSSKEKRKRGKEILAANIKRDNWYNEYFKNQRFLAKYTSSKYGCSVHLQDIRNKAYQKQYGLSKDCWVHEDVRFYKEHFSEEKLICGEKVVFTRNLDIDYTGGIVIGNGVAIAEGVKILTHGHSFIGNRYDSKFIPGSNRAYPTPLVIEDNVWIGSQCIIMPGCGRIGENSIISVGSVVSKPVPPNSIVAGNPAKVIYEMPEGYRVYYIYKKKEELK